ncbi:MAG: O-methyltransferase, partial [Methanomassiliicoccales archaeon]
MNLIDPAVERYAEGRTPVPLELLEELEEETRGSTDSPEMMVGRVQGALLRMLVSLIGAKRVLEIGTFTGYSAIMMGSALLEDGVLYTLDNDEGHLEIAKRYFDRVEFGDRIHVIEGDARDTLPHLQGQFDLAFIDADKPSYPFYYEEVIDKVRPGGLIALDNMLRGGE